MSNKVLKKCLKNAKPFQLNLHVDLRNFEMSGLWLTSIEELDGDVLLNDEQMNRLKPHLLVDLIVIEHQTLNNYLSQNIGMVRNDEIIQRLHSEGFSTSQDCSIFVGCSSIWHESNCQFEEGESWDEMFEEGDLDFDIEDYEYEELIKNDGSVVYDIRQPKEKLRINLFGLISEDALKVLIAQFN